VSPVEREACAGEIGRAPVPFASLVTAQTDHLACFTGDSIDTLSCR